MPPRRRPLLLASAIVLIALTLPSAAFGQATRTWVSGVGDDVNPCSRTAPCKTFAGAISKTAAGGEINITDPGGFGGVTITKSITIRGRGPTAGALVAGGNGITINAGTNDRITIDGLDINGTGIANPPLSNNGIRVLSAGRVNILNNEIYRFKTAISVTPTAAGAAPRVMVRNNQIHDNGIGIFNGPGNNSILSSIVTARHNTINDNVCGVVSGAFGSNNAVSPDAGTNCGTAAAGAADKPAPVRLYNNGIHDNGFGVFGRGANSVAVLAYNEIAGHTSFGLRRLDGAIMRTTQPATNVLAVNAADDAPNQTIPLG